MSPSKTGEVHRNAERYEQLWSVTLVQVAFAMDLAFMQYLSKVVGCCPDQYGVNVYGEPWKRLSQPLHQFEGRVVDDLQMPQEAGWSVTLPTECYGGGRQRGRHVIGQEISRRDVRRSAR